jgi:hypothetical protein
MTARIEGHWTFDIFKNVPPSLTNKTSSKNQAKPFIFRGPQQNKV